MTPLQQLVLGTLGSYDLKTVGIISFLRPAHSCKKDVIDALRWLEEMGFSMPECEYGNFRISKKGVEYLRCSALERAVIEARMESECDEERT